MIIKKNQNMKYILNAVDSLIKEICRRQDNLSCLFVQSIK